MLSIRIEHSGEGKFLLLQVRDGGTGSVKFCLVSYEGLDYSEILAEYRGYEAGEDEKVTCLGGGVLGMYHKERRIVVCGKSAGYGKADTRMVKLILKHNFPRHSIKIYSSGIKYSIQNTSGSRFTNHL
eukprot:TRINITY_DN16705_c0_g1_i1.p1 TRINITY_DN16705_c0_g1~~TRINITY_DN16705_c0_g1_i1.p1  ORF type:complete len:128 (+),score=21.01 TRINITY_DN16705_c0_g1_i1:146-529(+)